MTQHKRLTLTDFLRESDRIEGIRAPISVKKQLAFSAFLKRPLTLESVCAYQASVAPRKPLRDKPGMNIRVGNHVAPAGGSAIVSALTGLLEQIVLGSLTPHEAHVRFEKLHPFMDGNGRTGRAVWAWHMLKLGRDPFALGFLHRFYYQTLEAADDV